MLLLAAGASTAAADGAARDPYAREFGDVGRLVVGFPGGRPTRAAAYAVASRRDGTLVVGGFFSYPDDSAPRSEGSRFAVTQLRADGAFKKSFGGDGRVTTSVGKYAYVRAILPWERGSVLAAGYADERCVVVKYRRNGQLDPSFAANGKLRLEPDGCAVTELIRDGRDAFFLVGGIVRPGSGGLTPMVSRILEDGTRDQTFAADGTWLAQESPPIAVERTQLLADRRVIVLGSLAGFGMGVARYNTDGRLDRSFGVNGFATTGDLLADAIAQRATELPDGSLILGGEEWPDGHEVGVVSLVKVDKDGVFETSFGLEGVAQPATGYYDGADIYGLGALPDGRIFCVGEVDDGDGPVPYISILTGHGKPDRSFAPRGLFEIDTKPVSGRRWGYAFAGTQSASRIVVAGAAEGGFLLAAARHHQPQRPG